MIYTVTLNPSLDYVVQIPEFHLGRTNRTEREWLFPGGKGINVSIVLKKLGVPSTALGFVGGFTGEVICRKLKELGIAIEFIPVEGDSRINVKLRSPEGTEINGRGPDISREKLRELLEGLADLRSGDILVLAGSIPPSVTGEIYADILNRLKDRGVLTVVDTAGGLLRSVLPLGPFLIKPNLHELEEIFGVELTSSKEIAHCALKLRERGAQNVLVSLGGEGAVLAGEDGRVLSVRAPRGTLVNGVGAGDAMVAGFLSDWLDSRNCAEALAMGVAAGSASAYSIHFPAGEEILDLRREVRVEILE